jgi:two-component system, cell cycle sensor histidine kinase and response regulator CckA
LMRMQGLESLGTLAAGVAHDFKNLLAVVVGNATVLEEHLDERRLKQASGDIRAAALRAGDLCGLLMTYSGQSIAAKQPVALDTLVSEILALVRVRVPSGVRTRAEIEASAKPVLADPISLRQVVLNLVMNALDALGAAGEITVRARLDDGQDEPSLLDFRVGAGPWVILEVEDNGPGMSAEVQARAFEPFFTTKPEGHGFGLASVLGIVRGHGGAIDLESEPGGGTRFRIWLPVAV